MRRFTRLKSGDLELVSRYLQQHAQKLGEI
jgi:hypothetical protein